MHSSGVLVCIVALALGCAPIPTTAPRSAPSALSGAWLEQLASLPDAAVLRVDLASRRADPIYGALLLALQQALATHALSPSVDVSRALGSASDAVVLYDSTTEPVLVLRGVSGSIDPLSATGPDGRAQWRGSARPVANVEAFDFVPGVGALFVLVDRTWVVTAGAGQERVRLALDHETGRPVFAVEARPVRVPLMLHLAGRAVRAVGRHAQVTLLAAVIDDLRCAEIALHPDPTSSPRADALSLELTYESAEQAERALGLVAQAVGAFSRRGGPQWTWLSSAEMSRDGSRVRARARLPAWLLGALGAAASGARGPDGL